MKKNTKNLNMFYQSSEIFQFFGHHFISFDLKNKTMVASMMIKRLNKKKNKFLKLWYITLYLNYISFNVLNSVALYQLAKYNYSQTSYNFW